MPLMRTEAGLNEPLTAMHHPDRDAKYPISDAKFYTSNIIIT